MGFSDVTRYALQPSALMLDPDVARQQFVGDLARLWQRGQTQHQTALTDDRHAFDLNLRDRTVEANRGFKSLLPKERAYRPPPNPNAYMLNAILRDDALASYDRAAPQLRELDRANRGA